MALLTETEIYAHLRIDDSPPDDAGLIDAYKEAALDFIANYLNTPDYPETASIKAAALLIIGGLYEHREDKFVGTIVNPNPAVFSLLQPYRQDIGI